MMSPRAFGYSCLRRREVGRALDLTLLACAIVVLATSDTEPS
jgi:hypothetical protein